MKLSDLHKSNDRTPFIFCDDAVGQVGLVIIPVYRLCEVHSDRFSIFNIQNGTVHPFLLDETIMGHEIKFLLL